MLRFLYINRNLSMKFSVENFNRSVRRTLDFTFNKGGLMAKETFVRTKPHVNIGTIGHIDHGKTCLTSALTHVLEKQGKAQAKTYAEIAKGGTVRDESKILTIAVAHVEYETDKRHYAHID